jgi:hypothetical protein
VYRRLANRRAIRSHDECLDFTTSAEMIRQAVRYVETEHLGG